MLIGIPPLLGPELLAALRAMGHGDEVAIVDGNYPALEHARRLVRADGHALMPVIEAVLAVLPLDGNVPDPVLRTGLFNDPAQAAPIHHQMDALVARLRPGVAPRPLAGDQFYPRVRASHLVIATSEPELYANMILRKGVIAPGPTGAPPGG